MQVFTTSTTFTIPSGVTTLIIELWGGGGGGGIGAVGSRGAWGKGSISVIPGQSYEIIIGAGGIGSNNIPSCGGNTSFAEFFASGGNAGRVGGSIICNTGSNLPLKCNDCAMPPGSVLGYGAAGAQVSNGGQGLAIIYY
jgi:hypothetical protein